MSSVQAVHDVLAAVAPIRAQTGGGARIEPNERKDAEVYPAIVLQASSSPINTLSGWSGTDVVTVTVNYWANTYEGANALADLGRAALQAAGYTVDSSTDDFNENAGLVGKSCVTQVITYCS